MPQSHGTIADGDDLVAMFLEQLAQAFGERRVVVDKQDGSDDSQPSLEGSPSSLSENGGDAGPCREPDPDCWPCCGKPVSTAIAFEQSAAFATARPAASGSRPRA